MNRDGFFTGLSDKIVATMFTDFMRRYAMFEELINAAAEFLRGFYRELEMLKQTLRTRAPGMLDDVIKANCTDRMKQYVDANLSYHDNDVQSIIKLHSCKLGLEDYLLKAKLLLDELENLKCNVTDKINHSMDKYFSDFVLQYSEDAKEWLSHSLQEDTGEKLPPHESVSRAILMTVIYNMLKLEFTAQEKIIGALGLKTSSSELESYCMIWELRPYLKCNAIHLAWKYV